MAAQNQETESVLAQILQNAVRALGGSAAVAATWDDASRRFVVSSSYGIDRRELSKLQPLLDEAIPDLAESRTQFDFISEMGPKDPLPHSQQGEIQDSILALPLRLGGATVGLIYVLRSSDASSFSQLDPPVLAAFADQAAVAVQNARLAHLLVQEKQRVEAILEGSADGVYSLDSERRITGLNSAMEGLLGRTKDEVVGRHCAEVIGLKDREGRVQCPVNCPMLHGREETSESEGIIRSDDGRETDVALLYSIVRSPSGEPLNAVVNVRDISRQREIESLRSAFLAMLGHQLQTPLAIIKGYASTLVREDGQWEASTVRRSLGAIEEEADRLSNLVNRLLLASRLESGESELHKEPVDLLGLIERVIRRIQVVTEIHEFTTSFPSDFPPILADASLMEEVLFNLLENAVKYSPQGGVVSVSAGFDDGYLSFSVEDQGVGIPWWESSRIFERFHRTPDTVTQRIRGLGLGLYISDVIVKAHGGKMEVESEPGKGSRFTVFLPSDLADNVVERKIG